MIGDNAMNRDMYKHKMDLAIPAALFVVIEGLSAVPAMAGDGVVILQREVPARPAYRHGELGRATSIDTSPDDKVQQAVSSQRASLNPSNLHSTELGDADFATVSTGQAQPIGAIASQIKSTGLANTKMSEHGLNSSSNNYGSIQPVATSLTGTVSSAVGGATGHIASGITGATDALSGLTGSILRSSGH